MKYAVDALDLIAEQVTIPKDTMAHEQLREVVALADRADKLRAELAELRAREAAASEQKSIGILQLIDGQLVPEFVRFAKDKPELFAGESLYVRNVPPAAAAAVPDDVEKDAERLDWLVSEVALVQSLAISPPHGDGTTRYYIVWPEYGEEQRDTYATPREAIDAAVAALEVAAVPVAWRYQDANDNYRYRKYVAGFDVEYKSLRPVPLYAAPQPAYCCAKCGLAEIHPRERALHQDAKRGNFRQEDDGA